MDNRENDKPSKYPGHSPGYTANSASGADHKRGRTLLPMLIGGLILIILGMMAAVFFV